MLDNSFTETVYSRVHMYARTGSALFNTYAGNIEYDDLASVRNPEPDSQEEFAADKQPVEGSNEGDTTEWYPFEYKVSFLLYTPLHSPTHHIVYCKYRISSRFSTPCGMLVWTIAVKLISRKILTYVICKYVHVT